MNYSARIQKVHRETNPRYHELLTRFKAKTGCPVGLVAGNAIMWKADQDPALKKDYKNAFALD